MASFFRYPGGKAKFKDEILKAIKDTCEGCLEYREPFFGGGSVGLMVIEENNPGLAATGLPKFPFETFWINDKDIGVYSLWRAVVEFPDRLREQIKKYVPKVDDFEAFKDFFLNGNPDPQTPEEIVDVGFKKLAIHQISYSGLGVKSGGPLGGKEQKSKYKIDCRWSPNYMEKKLKNVHEQFKGITRVTNSDFSAMIEDVSVKAFIYLDPPYYVKGGELYHHSFGEADHIRMAEMLKNTKHSWVLSYDDCPEVRELYRWARIEAFDANYTINGVHTGEIDSDGKKKRASTKKTELLIFPK